MALDPGGWSGPHESAYGYHLVRVLEKRPARLPALESVRSRLAMALREELRDARMQRMMRRLRERYDVRVGEAGLADRAKEQTESWPG